MNGIANKLFWAAALGGHLEFLKWAIANGCEWDVQASIDAIGDGGHPDVIKWAWARDYVLLWRYNSDIVAERGHLEVLKWMIMNDMLCGSTRQAQ